MPTTTQALSRTDLIQAVRKWSSPVVWDGAISAWGNYKRHLATVRSTQSDARRYPDYADPHNLEVAEANLAVFDRVWRGLDSELQQIDAGIRRFAPSLLGQIPALHFTDNRLSAAAAAQAMKRLEGKLISAGKRKREAIGCRTRAQQQPPAKMANENRPATKPATPPPAKPAQTWPPDRAWHFRPGEFAFNGKKAPIDGNPALLLKLFAKKPGSPVTNRDIADEVYRDSLVEDSTIRKAVGRLRKVLRSAFHLVEADPLPSVARVDRYKTVTDRAWKLDESALSQESSQKSRNAMSQRCHRRVPRRVTDLR
jgi:hypothetical protein